MTIPSRTCLALAIVIALGAANPEPPAASRARRRSPSSYERILLGFTVPKDSVPWQVSIERDQRYVCGGALIGHDVVVTAAHCVNKHQIGMNVRVGSIFRNHDGVLISVREALYHKKYRDWPGSSHDIGLLFLSQSVKYSASIQPLLLPSPYAKIPVGKWAQVTGWGTISFPVRNYPEVLFGLNAEILRRKTCRKLLPPSLKPAGDQVCAYSGKLGKGVCKGDSGSPLVLKNYLIGVVSWGVPCARGVPDVFTKISHYVHWIHEQYTKHGMYAKNRTIRNYN